MQKSDLNIMIVEDDPTLGKALQAALSRAGFKALHVTKPDDAIAQAKLQPIHAALIDCMLPKMNGRDLAKILRNEIVPNLPVILMSGIYRDKSFAREAMQKTGAIGFLAKPFEISELIGTLETLLESEIETPFAPLQELFLKSHATHKQRIKAINDTGDVHSFDLIWILSLLIHPKISGHLNIISADGEVCGVGFRHGNIVQVNQNDAQSYFGVLMVESGFITQPEIDSVMQQTGKKKMGERLLEAGVLSPHAIQIVMSEQQGLRLGKIIAETSVKVNFIESDELREDAEIDRARFSEIMNEWLMSKVTVKWLKSFYTPWMHFNVKLGPEYGTTHPSFQLPVLQRVPGLAKILVEAETLELALGKISLPDAMIFPALHALMTSRLLLFGEMKVIRDYGAHRDRLVKLEADLAKQTLFERLGVSPRARDVEIKRAFHDLAKILHPDKLGPETPDDVRDITRKAFSKISQAYEVLSDPDRRAQYHLEVEKGRAEAIMEAEGHTESARRLLTKGDISLARESLEQAIALAPPTVEIQLLYMWSRIKSPGADKNPNVLELVRDGLAKIPPEDRYQSLFHFVRGLHLRATGDPELARKSLEQAVSIDSDFIDARRELSALKLAHSNENKGTDLLRGDLKDVVGLLFKKKK